MTVFSYIEGAFAIIGVVTTLAVVASIVALKISRYPHLVNRLLPYEKKPITGEYCVYPNCKCQTSCGKSFYDSKLCRITSNAK